jgi:hypothetical protein
LAQKGPDPSSLPAVDVIVVQDAELYFWNKTLSEFEEQGAVTAQIVKSKTGYEFWLVAFLNDALHIAHLISSSMNQRLAVKLWSITWNHISADGDVNSWVIRFKTKESYDEFVQAFTQAQWQTLHQTPWGKIKARISSGCP